MKMLIIVLCLMAFLMDGSTALPFSKNSGVKELDGKQLKEALKTHKPVFLLLYAPWCGHCKSIHPEYEKLGKSTEGVVDVIAVDADKHKEVGGQYNLKGFPTVVYYGMDKKKSFKPYQGERKATPMHNAAMALVETNLVSVLKDEAALKRLLESSTYAVVLFTEKDKVPPLVNVLAYEPAFKGTISFAVARKKSTAVVDKFEVPSYPSIAILTKEEGEVKAKTWFDGKIAYDAIRSFVRKEAGLPEDSKSGGGDKSGSSAPPPKKPTVAKPAIPVEPIEFTSGQMKLFCDKDAPLINEQQPFCVVFFVAEKEEVERVSTIHTQFRNEPFVIFYSTDFTLLTKLDMVDAPKAHTVVVFKGGKKGIRYTGKSFSNVDELTAEAPSILEKVSGGEMKMQKGEALPKL